MYVCNCNNEENDNVRGYGAMRPSYKRHGNGIIATFLLCRYHNIIVLAMWYIATQ